MKPLAPDQTVRRDFKLRFELERTILGECLLENAFLKVADILSPINFSKANLEQGILYDHQLIYQAFNKLYPVRPIELITVASCLPNGYASYLAELTMGVSSSVPIRTHAVMLLELSIREAFIHTIQKLQDVSDLHIRPALYEIQDEALDYDNDIFEVIEKSLIYLEPFGNIEVTDTISRFDRSINKKVRTIKQHASIDILLDNLLRLNGTAHDLNSQLAIAHCCQVIKSVLAKNSIDTQTLTHIISITP